MSGRFDLKSHYSRDGRFVSLKRIGLPAACRNTLALLSIAATALHASAQYPGQVAKESKDKAVPPLRAVAVLEWTGDAGKPKKSRLVPITVYDGEQLQDGGVYLARPQPLALAGEVEYELKNNGKSVGLFDVENAAQEEGMWVGYGKWLPMPAPKPAATAAPPEKVDDEGSDKPVLHRKHGSGSLTGGDKGSAPDPDRPTMHKKTDDSSSDKSSAGGGTGTTPAGGSSTGGSSTGPTTSSSKPGSSGGQAPDPDQPTIHKPASTDTSNSDNGDRPKLKKSKERKQEDIGYVESMQTVTDPNRPHLTRGVPSDLGPRVTPSLMGLPPDMEQAVAISDVRTAPEHLWTFSWSDPADELKMKSALEDIARNALGLQVAALPTPAPKTKSAHAKTHMKLPPVPAPLVDEQFRVFELAYGSGATLVLSARTDGPLNQQKFVTLIAQPDLYGGILVLFKSVTDGAHLDDTPRMRLVDAVDALADNRGELLFELRGSTMRQFALYRVLRGTAEKIFVTGGGEFGSVNGE